MTESGAPYTLTVIKIFAAGAALLMLFALVVIVPKNPAVLLVLVGGILVMVGAKVLIVNHLGWGFILVALGLPLFVIGWSKMPKYIDIKLPTRTDKDKPKKDPLNIR
jgi:hypothetical protein